MSQIRHDGSPLSSLHRNVTWQAAAPWTTGGFGLFATGPIRAGEVVWEEEETEEAGRRVPLMELALAPASDVRLHYGYQCSATHFNTVATAEEAQRDLSWYMNHSCHPSVWPVGNDGRRLAARWDLVAGDEITYDYAASETFFERIRECRCGSPLCRGAVTRDDWRNPVLRARYGDHWMPHVLALINRSNAPV